jgi:DNA-binding IclR family transcriptional regulator
MPARAQLGPEARRAYLLPVDGQKRRKILVLIGAFLDAGRNPSITELAARARLPRSVVMALVDRLERDQFLGVERAPRQRNTYRLLDGGRR